MKYKIQNDDGDGVFRYGVSFRYGSFVPAMRFITPSDLTCIWLFEERKQALKELEQAQQDQKKIGKEWKTVVNGARKYYKAVCYHIPWFCNEYPGDCKLVEPSLWPLDLEEELDWVYYKLALVDLGYGKGLHIGEQTMAMRVTQDTGDSGVSPYPGALDRDVLVRCNQLNELNGEPDVEVVVPDDVDVPSNPVDGLHQPEGNAGTRRATSSEIRILEKALEEAMQAPVAPSLAKPGSPGGGCCQCHECICPCHTVHNGWPVHHHLHGTNAPSRGKASDPAYSTNAFDVWSYVSTLTKGDWALATFIAFATPTAAYLWYKAIGNYFF